MSVYSQAWHDMDPDIRQFYVSVAQLRTAYLRPFWAYDDLSQEYRKCHFEGPGFYFIAITPLGVASHNWTFQLWDHGSFDTNITTYWTYDYPPPLHLDLPIDPFGFLPIYQQFEIIPTDGYPYPRPTCKIPKTYWTGVPRRRRNLPT